MATRRCISSALEDEDEEDVGVPPAHPCDGLPLVLAVANPSLLAVTRKRLSASAFLDVASTTCAVIAATFAWLHVEYVDKVGDFTWQFFVTAKIRSCNTDGACDTVAISDLKTGEWEDTTNLSAVSKAVYGMTIACAALAGTGLLTTLYSLFRITHELKKHGKDVNGAAQEERFWMRRALFPPIRHASVLLVAAGAITSYALIATMFVRDNRLDIDTTVDFYIGFWMMVVAAGMQGIALLTWLLPCHSQ